MDDQYQQGFERLLSDMDEAPPWEQVSTQHAARARVPSRSRGLLVAAAAFVVTVVAVGAVVFAIGDGVDPVAPVTAATVDYLEIAWRHETELTCGDLETVDNKGFETAKVEIWGPNADDLLRVDVTAPDGTVERLITAYDPGAPVGGRVWYAYDGSELSRVDRPYRIADCIRVEGSDTYSYAPRVEPVSMSGHHFERFVAFPTAYPGGGSWDHEADLAELGKTSQDEWRGIPITVYTETYTGAIERYVSEHWVDSESQRLERFVYFVADERFGTAITTIEVINRDSVPADSVSFSVEDMTLTLDTAKDAPQDDEQTPTTTTTAPEPVDVSSFDDVESINEEISSRRQAMHDDALTLRDKTERLVAHNEAILGALEAQSDPPAEQHEIDLQRVVVLAAKAQMEHAALVLERMEAELAALEVQRTALLDAVEAAMAADRAAADERAAQHAPYLVVEPIGLEPPAALPGTDGASGSGCYPGSGDLPDGIWFGYLLDRDGLSIDFDVACMYYGELAWEMAAAVGDEANGDVWFVDDDAISRTLPVAESAVVWTITGDATEGHQVLSYASEWTGTESTYMSCPGEDCRIWIYVNGGTVDAIVEQYTP